MDVSPARAIMWRRISARSQGIVDGDGAILRAYQYQHDALDVLTERWRRAEALGFDVVWNRDTVVEPDRPRHVMYDGPTALTLMATSTS